MSVTPDFVGQVYKDTATGNIWRANSTTPGDWTLEVQNMQVKWNPRTSQFGSVTAMSCDGASGNNGGLPGITNLIFEESQWLHGINYKKVGTDLISISAPNLTEIDPDFFANTSGLVVEFADNLATISAPNLVSVGGYVTIDECPLLTTLDLSSLTNAGYVAVYSNASLATLDLSSLLALNYGVLSITTNASLVTVLLNSWTPFNGDSLSFSNNAFSDTTVNHILSRCVANAGYVSGDINLSGGTNAAPTGQGIVDKATLTGRGVVVITN